MTQRISICTSEKWNRRVSRVRDRQRAVLARNAVIFDRVWIGSLFLSLAARFTLNPARFHLAAAGDSPPVFVLFFPPLDFTFGGRATDRHSSPPRPPIEWRVASCAIRCLVVLCARFARSLSRAQLRRAECAWAVAAYSINVSATGVTRKSSIVRLLVSRVARLQLENTCIDTTSITLRYQRSKALVSLDDLKTKLRRLAFN